MKKAEETIIRPTEQEANEEAERLISLYRKENYKLSNHFNLKLIDTENGQVKSFAVILKFVK